jgi:hypothetical protein
MHPEILSIALYRYVAAYTPGPNNVVASYSGFNFGIKNKGTIFYRCNYGDKIVIEGLRLLLLFVFENRFKSSVCKTKSLYTIEESLKELKLRFNYYDRFIKVDYKVNLLKLLCIVSKLVSDEFFLDLLYKYLRLCSLNSKAEYLVKTDAINLLF